MVCLAVGWNALAWAAGATPASSATAPDAAALSSSGQPARARAPTSSVSASQEVAPSAEVTPETAERAASSDGVDHPWSKGVSAERRQAAMDGLREGNLRLREASFRSAVEKYREALSQWDHPGIHYNLALALRNLDQLLEVREHLLAAMRYGAAPLDVEKFERAKAYMAEVEKQLSALDLHCEEPGAVVSLDGRVVFRAPGHYNTFVNPGLHRFTATKEGYMPTDFTETLIAGKPATVQVQLHTASQLIKTKRPLPLWQPIAVMVAGAAALGAGAVMTVRANHKFEKFDQWSAAACGNGCTPTAGYTEIRDQGERLRTAATAFYVAGGVTLAAGILFLILDGPVPYRVDPRRSATALSVEPVIGSGVAGLMGVGRF